MFYGRRSVLSRYFVLPYSHPFTLKEEYVENEIVLLSERRPCEREYKVLGLDPVSGRGTVPLF